MYRVMYQLEAGGKFYIWKIYHTRGWAFRTERKIGRENWNIATKVEECISGSWYEISELPAYNV